MQAMNFYTTNSWTGSNYDGNLSTKEIAAKVLEMSARKIQTGINSK